MNDNDKELLNKGCWYCGKNNEYLSFSCEFDTYVHLDCLRDILAKNDRNDMEARIMGRELL